jgi:hypothetical protein
MPPATDGLTGAPASQSPCDLIKARGVTILVLYTPYNPVVPAATPTYVDYVQPLVQPISNSVVTANLQACASPGDNFFQANSAADIDAALKKMLLIASSSAARFTH